MHMNIDKQNKITDFLKPKTKSSNKSLNYISKAEEMCFSNYKNKRLNTTSKNKNNQIKLNNFSKSSPPKSKEFTSDKKPLVHPQMHDSFSLIDNQFGYQPNKKFSYNLKSVGYKANLQMKDLTLISPSFVFEDHSEKDDIFSQK